MQKYITNPAPCKIQNLYSISIHQLKKKITNFIPPKLLLYATSIQDLLQDLPGQQLMIVGLLSELGAGNIHKGTILKLDDAITGL